MRVACVIKASELKELAAELIVFPEGVRRAEILAAQSSHPDAVVVGAVVENRRSRAALLHRGLNQIDYLKARSDGRTIGTGDARQDAVYDSGTLCIGVLICMDIDHVELSQAVIDTIRSSPANLKVLCIPADMSSDWNVLNCPKRFEGIYVVLCNHTLSYQGISRCQSFIADTSGRRIVVQAQDEPIYADVP
jgi:predicted amidohydrolase